MSERMIELQRAKLGLPPVATQPTAAAPGAQSTAVATAPLVNATLTQQQRAAAAQRVAAASRQQMTPQQMAAATVHAQEAQLQTFLHRLQQRDAESTVPTALSRRMLQRQGVGFLDDTVSSVVSATADRFLATVLSQAVACRNQRLKGNEMALEEEKHVQKHILQHQADADDRKRRKVARQEAKKRHNLQAVEAGERLEAAGLKPNSTTTTTTNTTSKSKKKKKKGEEQSDDDDDDMSYDSLDEEEDYYKDHYGAANGARKGNEDDNETNQDMLTLRDLERPLEAWDVHLTGKVGLGIVVAGETTTDVESDNEEDGEKEETVVDVEMNGNAPHNGEADGDDASQASPAAKKAAASPAKGKASSSEKAAKSTTPSQRKAGSKAPSPVPTNNNKT